MASRSSVVVGTAARMPHMDLGLTGAGVLVTGASGGIGSATARAFAAEGAAGPPGAGRERSAATPPAALRRARASARHVREAGDGSLVLVASTAGLFGEAGHADYAAAKAAIAHGLALSLKNEFVRFAPA